MLLQHTVLPYKMDEQPPLKEMRNVINYCRGRRKQLIIGCDTNECYILWGGTGINPEVENLLKYLVSSDANILNESDVDFSVGRLLLPYNMVQ